MASTQPARVLPARAGIVVVPKKCVVVAVEGIIGAGKSTLCNALERELRLAYVPEPVEDNPYLDKFYAEPSQWALHMQMWLVARRIKAMIMARDTLSPEHRGLLVDRSILGDRVFAEIQKKRGHITKDMWPIYDDFFTTMSLCVPPPDILVYLNASPTAAMERVHSRGRQSEQSGVTLDYQAELKAGYDSMVSRVENAIDQEWTQRTAVMRIPAYLTNDGVERVCEQISLLIEDLSQKKEQE